MRFLKGVENILSSTEKCDSWVSEHQLGKLTVSLLDQERFKHTHLLYVLWIPSNLDNLFFEPFHNCPFSGLLVECLTWKLFPYLIWMTNWKFHKAHLHIKHVHMVYTIILTGKWISYMCTYMHENSQNRKANKPMALCGKKCFIDRQAKKKQKLEEIQTWLRLCKKKVKPNGQFAAKIKSRTWKTRAAFDNMEKI